MPIDGSAGLSEYKQQLNSGPEERFWNNRSLHVYRYGGCFDSNNVGGPPPSPPPSRGAFPSRRLEHCAPGTLRPLTYTPIHPLCTFYLRFLHQRLIVPAENTCTALAKVLLAYQDAYCIEGFDIMKMAALGRPLPLPLCDAHCVQVGVERLGKVPRLTACPPARGQKVGVALTSAWRPRPPFTNWDMLFPLPTTYASQNEINGYWLVFTKPRPPSPLTRA